MQDTKYFLKSKRFWGLAVSLMGFIVITIAQFFGYDVSKYVNAIGLMLQVFGIPIATYGAMTAEKPLGFSKNESK